MRLTSPENQAVVQTVRVDTVAVGIGQKLSTPPGTLVLKSQLPQCVQEHIEKILIKESKH